ncbi:RimK-like ATP-grasp domain-containing protein [Modicisalibacter ilicicola DSM 19980]|uniref:RimK-like ATP-grasp domain-containing protein n=1 Tax=Modicisalibacter ilicicola DSM 19980 TaxID=1121942 RepID=A0A1M4WDS4_9GAMM|nr:hypothetical protein [Halomonas ilicicola]SHE79310.1 RimK-like ATP-grasp domain-containing protein [Halomonas ilicicola DSM 19980]
MIAIHARSGSFSDKWIEYCERHRIAYKVVNCYASNIIEEMHPCSGLMWHWKEDDTKALLFARQLTVALEAMGKQVFPGSATIWHYDDKIAQKYLLEALDAPLIPTHLFYDERQAIAWTNTTEFPKVFKLRGGILSENVRIARDKKAAIRFIRKAFGSGYRAKSRVHYLNTRMRRFWREKSLKSFVGIGRGVYRVLFPTAKVASNRSIERNYVYFQDFVPDNDHDIRVVVIGARAFAIKRLVQEGDFRASGSGHIVYDPRQIPEECLKVAFDVTEQLGSQCAAYDFVFGESGPMIVEVSHSFWPAVHRPCPGYWTKELAWVDGTFSFEDFMIEDFVGECTHAREERSA